MKRDRQSNSDVLCHGQSRTETNRTPTQTKAKISRRQERSVTSCLVWNIRTKGYLCRCHLPVTTQHTKLAYVRSTNVVNSWNMHTAALHSTRDGQPFRFLVPYMYHNFPPIGSCASHRCCCSTDWRAKPECKLKCNMKYI